MRFTRRELLVLAAIPVVGCATDSGPGASFPVRSEPVDAGAAARFAAGKVNEEFRNSHGFVVVRLGEKVFALSAICTHRHCKIEATDKGFECPCHGATYAVDGKVTGGPARRDLSRFAVEKDEQGHLIVRVDRAMLGPEEGMSAGRFVNVD